MRSKLIQHDDTYTAANISPFEDFIEALKRGIT
jgi:hypothetical protein